MRRTHHSAPLATAYFESPCGWIGLLANAQGLYEIILAANKAQLHHRLQPHAQALNSSSSVQYLTDAEASIKAYFNSADNRCQMTFDWRGLSEFSVKVLTTLIEVPSGQVVSYGDLAKRVGSPGAARAIGRVMASNPFPILIPCHRVLGAGGSMTGYSGGKGVSTKQWLLDFEGYSMSR